MTLVAQPDPTSRRRRPRPPAISELLAQVLTELQLMNTNLTEMGAKVGGRAVNSYLRVGSFAINADGYYHLHYGVAAGAVHVYNPTAHQMIVAAGGPLNYQPSIGTGVMYVAAGTEKTLPTAAHEHTVYGTPGDVFSVWVTAQRVTPTP